MRALVLAATVMLPAIAAAKCAGVEDCMCGDRPLWAALVRYEAAGDGGTTSVIEAATLDAGEIARDLELRGGEPGTRWVVTYSGGSRPVLPDGGIRCLNATVAAATWPAALVDGSCTKVLATAGYRVPECRDNGAALFGCGCATSDSALPALAGLALLARRRRR